MKKEYDFTKAKKVGPLADPKVSKVQTSIRLDGDVMIWLQTKAHEQSIPYQTFINKLLREVMQKPSLEQRVEKLESKIGAQKKGRTG